VIHGLWHNLRYAWRVWIVLKGARGDDFAILDIYLEGPPMAGGHFGVFW
jgi:hypothetical protein